MKNIQMKNQIEKLKGCFGRPSAPQITGRVKAKVEIVSPFGYVAIVRIGFFKWRYLRWTYYDEQPNIGFTKARAVLTISKNETGIIDAIELVEDFKKYKGACVTIW